MNDQKIYVLMAKTLDIAAHMAAVNAALGKPPERRQERAEPMPYRLRIAIAFASLAGALTSLYCWYP